MKEKTWEARKENIPEVTDFIDRELEALDCSMKTQAQIDMAVDEVFVNIAMYAYASGTGNAAVRFEANPETRVVSITFRDQGMPFNPLEQPEPDITAGIEERPIGGLGIFLVRKTMDDISYVRENGFNVLTIRKKI